MFDSLLLDGDDSYSEDDEYFAYEEDDTLVSAHYYLV